MNEQQNPIEVAWTELEAIVGREYLWPASANDAIDGLQPAKVIAPANAQEIAKVLQYCSSAGVAVIPRGGGSKLGLGNRPQKADLILSTERLNRVVEHVWGDMTVIVEAGCTIENVQRAVNEHRQRLAIDPLWPEQCTVGGLLATGESGTLRIRYGALRDLVLGVEVALPDGALIKAGGKVVKNVAGYDLTKLAIGSLGTLGVITRAVFRLHPIPVSTATYSTVVANSTEATKVVLAILDSHLVYTGLQLRAGGVDQIVLDVRVEGIPESLQDQFAKLGKIAGYAFTESPDDIWNARQRLFTQTDNSVIAKCSVLPSQIGALCEAVFRQAKSARGTAAVVAQGTGVADVRFDTADLASLPKLLKAVRAEIDAMGGTLVVQQCPAAIKQSLDVWGAINGALPLMRQIKGKFDPARTLNPGRFVGAI